MNHIGIIKNKHILLLQGPIGFFFKKLDFYLKKGGAITYRIGFNAGDELFSYRKNYTAYKDNQKNWPIFIKEFLLENGIQKIFLFGDCRYYQSITIQIAMALNIEVYVFEEGYIRPHYITLERYGVNDYSLLPRDASFYQNQTLKEIPIPHHATPNPVYIWSIVISYYFIAKFFHLRYPKYKHHRNYSAMLELFFGVRSLVRKAIYTKKDKPYQKTIKSTLSKKYFFIPLQTHNDFQILQHSEYGSIEKFIIEVLESFSKYGEKEMFLLFKHHPMDRGRKNYEQFIKIQSQLLKIATRVIILHDIHLPTCLQHAKGTITINSTVGLSSLYHNTPTITLGNALYDIEGLTFQGTLDEFWHEHSKPDKILFQKFSQYIIEQTQLNGNFYGLFPKELIFI